MPREQAVALFTELHQDFKVDIINRLPGRRDRVSIYRTGTFVDLCRGPHVPDTGWLQARSACSAPPACTGAATHATSSCNGCTERHGSRRTSWTRTCMRLEEARKRDHRRLGADLDLFSFPDEIGSGLPVFHPNGGLVRSLMEEYSRKRHAEGGYSFVNTPHITKEDLFKTSGHLEWFAEGMFPPMELDEGTKYYLKPMNCPMHILIYRSRMRSYRELPLRLFEFGSVYRYEKSGVVHGLTRVRGLTMDDAHIFCAREQMMGELISLLDFTLGLLRDFGLTDFYLELSTRPEAKAVGTMEEWEEATQALRLAAEGRNLELVLDEGGGAFYGPKISVQARDAIGRTWQMSTIQVDFQFPQRFDLSFVDNSGTEQRPIMIHRALFGSIERFFAILLEHYAGHFPLWLAPVQCALVPVQDDSEEVMAYIRNLADAMRTRGLRVSLDDRHGERMQARVRDAELKKVPYVVVIGKRDIERADDVVRVRDVRRNTPGRRRDRRADRHAWSPR